MKQEVLIFLFDGYADWEAAYLAPELNGPDSPYAVRTVALDAGPKTSMGGFHALPDYTLETCPAEFAALVLPGGNTWLEGQNEGILPLVDRAVQAGIPVGAICNACAFLAQHGYLDHIPHSGNTLAFLKQCAPAYRGDAWFQERQAVVGGNIVTANGYGTLEFTRALLILLNAKSDEELNQWYVGHRQGYYPA